MVTPVSSPTNSFHFLRRWNSGTAYLSNHWQIPKTRIIVPDGAISTLIHVLSKDYCPRRRDSDRWFSGRLSAVKLTRVATRSNSPIALCNCVSALNAFRVHFANTKTTIKPHRRTLAWQMEEINTQETKPSHDFLRLSPLR